MYWSSYRSKPSIWWLLIKCIPFSNFLTTVLHHFCKSDRVNQVETYSYCMLPPSMVCSLNGLVNRTRGLGKWKVVTNFLYVVQFFQVDHCWFVPVLGIWIGMNVVAPLPPFAHHSVKVALPLVYDGKFIRRNKLRDILEQIYHWTTASSEAMKLKLRIECGLHPCCSSIVGVGYDAVVTVVIVVLLAVVIGDDIPCVITNKPLCCYSYSTLWVWHHYYGLCAVAILVLIYSTHFDF